MPAPTVRLRFRAGMRPIRHYCGVAFDARGLSVCRVDVRAARLILSAPPGCRVLEQVGPGDPDDTPQTSGAFHPVPLAQQIAEARAATEAAIDASTLAELRRAEASQLVPAVAPSPRPGPQPSPTDREPAPRRERRGDRR